MLEVKPDVVVHQLTDLALIHDPSRLAAALAIDRGAPGIYNIAEPSPLISVAKARRELGWDPDFRVQEGTTSP